MYNEIPELGQKKIEKNLMNKGLAKQKFTNQRRLNFIQNKNSQVKEIDNTPLIKHIHPPKTSYSNNCMLMPKGQITDCLKLGGYDSTSFEKAIELKASRFTVNSEMINNENDNSNGMPQIRIRCGKMFIPDCSKKFINDHITEYRKVHNKIIDKQLNYCFKGTDKKDPSELFLIHNQQGISSEKDLNFRPLTSSFQDYKKRMFSNPKEIGIDKPKTAFHNSRKIIGNPAIFDDLKLVRPESRYKKESLCIPLIKEREKSPEFKVPIQKMDYEHYKKNNAILPSCWI